MPAAGRPLVCIHRPFTVLNVTQPTVSQVENSKAVTVVARKAVVAVEGEHLLGVEKCHCARCNKLAASVQSSDCTRLHPQSRWVFSLVALLEADFSGDRYRVGLQRGNMFRWHMDLLTCSSEDPRSTHIHLPTLLRSLRALISITRLVGLYLS